jgi:hypothetical protein
MIKQYTRFPVSKDTRSHMNLIQSDTMALASAEADNIKYYGEHFDDVRYKKYSIIVGG